MLTCHKDTFLSQKPHYTFFPPVATATLSEIVTTEMLKLP